MSKWKQAVVFGSLGLGAVLLITGKRPAGVAAATVGLVLLAGEYPEQFERVWQQAPEYISRGTQIFSGISRVIDRTAEEIAERSMIGTGEERSSEYLT